MISSAYQITRHGDGPILAAAIHDGHALRPEVAAMIALNDAERLREEDPYTGLLTKVADTRIVGLRSRFEVDFNRSRSQAVYLRPEDAWGLQVWRMPPSQELIDQSLQEYDNFYVAVRRVLNELLEQHGRLVVYDIHSYNHRRQGAGAVAASAVDNPEINIGTGTMDRSFWSPVVDRLIEQLAECRNDRRRLDVRENVKFRGGYFGNWIHQTFPQQVCAISIEFKKVFMDEWTGQADFAELAKLADALRSTLQGVRCELERI